MIEQIVEVIEEVREAFRSRSNTQIVYPWRLKATRSIAARRRIKQQSVNDKLLRKLRPDVNSLSKFDNLLQKWLDNGSQELKTILIKHASGVRDRELINNAFYIAPESDIAIAEEFGVDPNEQSFKEGKAQLRLHLIKERNRNLVNQAKQTWAKSSNENIPCDACGFSFLHAYGSPGAGFIEAHHKVPISTLNADTVVRISDLVPVCSNCHSILHRHRPWLTIEQLKKLISDQKKKFAG